MEDKNNLAMVILNGVTAAEKTHADFYAQAMSDLGEWRVKKKFLVCNICGFTTRDMALKKCPVFSSARKKFTEAE